MHNKMQMLNLEPGILEKQRSLGEETQESQTRFSVALDSIVLRRSAEDIQCDKTEPLSCG